MSTTSFLGDTKFDMTNYSKLKSIACIAISLLLSSLSQAQDKSILKCDGKSSVIVSSNVNITAKEAKDVYRAKPMSLRVIIDGERIAVNSYEYKNIETKFPDKSTFYTFEHGNLEIKDTYYDGYLSVERNKIFKDATDNPLEKGLYFYQNTRFILDRLDGEFTWTLTYHGNTSWINDLLTNKVKDKDKYLNLEVKGVCKRDNQKILF